MQVRYSCACVHMCAYACVCTCAYTSALVCVDVSYIYPWITETTQLRMCFRVRACESEGARGRCLKVGPLITMQITRRTFLRQYTIFSLPPNPSAHKYLKNYLFKLLRLFVKPYVAFVLPETKVCIHGDPALQICSSCKK